KIVTPRRGTVYHLAMPITEVSQLVTIPPSGTRTGGALVPRPAVQVVLAVAAGILLDRFWNLPLAVWLLGGGLGLAGSLVLFLAAGQSRRAALLGSSALLLTMTVLGAGRHHLFWSVRAADDVSTFASYEPQPARLV